MLGGERDHRRGAAERRRDRGALEIVGVHEAHAVSCSMWQWLSTPPGSTSLPAASISRRPAGSPWPIATMRSPRIATSAGSAGGGGDGAAADDEIEVGHRQALARLGCVSPGRQEVPAYRSAEIYVDKKATSARNLWEQGQYAVQRGNEFEGRGRYGGWSRRTLGGLGSNGRPSPWRAASTCFSVLTWYQALPLVGPAAARHGGRRPAW